MITRSPRSGSRLPSPISGPVTFRVLLVAAAGLLLAAGIAAARRHPDLPVSPTTFALLGVMIGLATGSVFIATKPGGVGAVGVAWGFWAFGIGSVAGIAAAQLRCPADSTGRSGSPARRAERRRVLI